MSGPVAACATAALTGAWFLLAAIWAKRYGERLTLDDPISWAIAGAGVALAGFAHNGGTSIELAAVSVCAASDRQTGYVLDVVLASAAVLLSASAALAASMTIVASGAVTCGGALWLVHVASRGRGLGLGDVKLAALIGACLGAPAGFVAIGAAFVIGGAIAAVGLASGHRARGDVVRFAPYLAVGSFASVLWGQAG